MKNETLKVGKPNSNVSTIYIRVFKFIPLYFEQLVQALPSYFESKIVYICHLIAFKCGFMQYHLLERHFQDRSVNKK